MEGGGIRRYISCSWLLLSHMLPGRQIHPHTWDVVQTAQYPGHMGSMGRVGPQGQWNHLRALPKLGALRNSWAALRHLNTSKKGDYFIFSVSPQKICPFTHGCASESRKSADTGMAFPAEYEESENECDHWAGLGTHKQPIAWRYFKNAKFCCDPS